MLSINSKEVESLIKEAVSECYSQTGKFSNETIFKYELFHQLAKRKLSGVGLTEKLKGSNTCILHSEAKAFNGQAGYLKERGIATKAQADLLFCNPYEKNSTCEEFGKYNYKPEVIIELKQKYSASDVKKIIQNYEPYIKHFGFRGGFYIIYANDCKVDFEYIKELESEFHLPIQIKALCRNSPGILSFPVKQKQNWALGNKALYDCFAKALGLYANSWNQTEQAFYWRNCQQQGELNKPHTFPCEGDFNARLYHEMRGNAGFESAKAEYKVQRMGRVDFAIEAGSKRYFIEVKMNWDQFRKGCEPPTKIANKFSQIGLNREDESCQKIVVVIQGNPHAKKNMLRALEEFSKQHLTIVRQSETTKKMEVYEASDSWNRLYKLVT